MSLQNTPILSDAVPRVGTLGWYALPRWGKSNDGVSIACPRPKKDIRVAPNACGTPTLSTTNPDKSGCPRFRSRYRSHIRSRTSLRKSFLYIPTTSKQPDSRVFYHHQSDHHSAEATHLLRLAINSNNPKASKVVEGSGIAPATMAVSGSLS